MFYSCCVLACYYWALHIHFRFFPSLENEKEELEGAGSQRDQIFPFREIFSIQAYFIPYFVVLLLTLDKLHLDCSVYSIAFNVCCSSFLSFVFYFCFLSVSLNLFTLGVPRPEDESDVRGTRCIVSKMYSIQISLPKNNQLK